MENSKIFKIVAMAIISFAAMAQSATLNLSGTTIENCTAQSGGGIYAAGAGVTVTMTGGSIINNAHVGLNMGTNSTITIGGTAVISGNVNSSSEPENLRLQGDGTYIVISEEHPPKEGMSVGVKKGTNLDDGVFVQSGAKAEHLQYFFSDINLATGIEVITIEHDSTNGGRLSLKRVPPTFADLIFHETENLSPRKYTGTAQKVELTGTARNASSTNYLGTMVRIFYEGTEGTDHPKNWQAMYNPINVGKYAVTLTTNGASASNLGYGAVTDLPLGTLIIYSDDDKPVPTADLLAYDLTTPVTYTGSPQSAAVTPKPNIHGLGAITVYYDDGSGEGKSTTAPTNAGTYAITVDIAEGGDPTSGWGAAEGLSLGNFVIDKAPAPTITFPTSTPIIYGAALSTSTLSGGSTAYGSFEWTDGATIPPVTNSGYEVTFTPSAGTVNNYETITTTTEIVAVTVNRANGAGTPTLNAVANWTYNGTPSAVTVSGGRSAEQTTANVIIEYKAQSADDATYTAVVPMQAGNYTARARWAQSANYLAHVISGTQNFTINKAAGSFGTPSALSATWSPTLTLASITPPTNYAWVTSSTTITAAGDGQSFPATYTDPSGNYTTASGNITVNVAKADQAALVITGVGAKKANDLPFQLATTGGTTGGTVTYTLVSGTAATVTEAGVVTISAAGDIKVKATMAGNANYNDVTSANLLISIGTTSILSSDRNIPQTKPNNSAVVIAPVNVTAFEITVGPNPVRGSDGVVNIFLSGKRVDDGTLTVYDVTGNVINKITIRDNAIIGNIGRRVVGSWDLKDGKGNHVSAGSYLLRGTIKTTDGKRERVSVIVGVR